MKKPVPLTAPKIGLLLPWPPSVNDRYQSNKALTESAKAFRAHVVLLCQSARIQPLPGRLTVELMLNPPTSRTWDIDNRIKPTLDALQHGGCYANDNAIDRLVVERGGVVEGGSCRVFIAPMVPFA